MTDWNLPPELHRRRHRPRLRRFPAGLRGTYTVVVKRIGRGIDHAREIEASSEEDARDDAPRPSLRRFGLENSDGRLRLRH